jgi:hypothetical protein
MYLIVVSELKNLILSIEEEIMKTEGEIAALTLQKQTEILEKPTDMGVIMKYDIGIEYAIAVCKQLRSLGFYAIHTDIEDLETGNKQAGILINN